LRSARSHCLALPFQEPLRGSTERPTTDSLWTRTSSTACSWARGTLAASRSSTSCAVSQRFRLRVRRSGKCCRSRRRAVSHFATGSSASTLCRSPALHAHACFARQLCLPFPCPFSFRKGVSRVLCRLQFQPAVSLGVLLALRKRGHVVKVRRGGNESCREGARVRARSFARRSCSCSPKVSLFAVFGDAVCRADGVCWRSRWTASWRCLDVFGCSLTQPFELEAAPTTAVAADGRQAKAVGVG